MLHSENTPSEMIPPHLVCIISQQIFLEPVTVFPSGRVYEKEMVQRLIDEAKAKGENTIPLCPITREPITGYTPAWSVKDAVEYYLSTHESAREKQYEPATVIPAPVTSPSSPSPDFDQIREDEELARELQHQFIEESEAALREARERREAALRAEAALREQRERNSLAAFREQRLAQERITRAAAENRQGTRVQLNIQEKNERDVLINDVQNIIWALGFEPGPQPRGSIDNDSLVAFAFVESFFLAPLPWQKIKVNEGLNKGPIVQTAMYEILKAAIRSLKELDEGILNNAKAQYAGQYDKVKTVLGGEVSLSDGGYGNVAIALGTVTDHPGYLVNQILERVDNLLHDLCHKYNVTQAQTEQRRLGNN